MKRFIRTKDGKIFDLVEEEKNDQIIEIGKLNGLAIFEFSDEPYVIIKQADTIEDLIEVGDLVKVKERITNRESIIIYNNLDLDYYELLELYTKQGRSYVLVAEKVDGEWRVI